MIKRALMTAIFFTIPAMALIAYALYWARNYVRTTWGVEIGAVTYNAILSVGFALAIWVTAGRFLRKLKAEKDDKQRKQ